MNDIKKQVQNETKGQTLTNRLFDETIDKTIELTRLATTQKMNEIIDRKYAEHLLKHKEKNSVADASCLPQYIDELKEELKKQIEGALKE